MPRSFRHPFKPTESDPCRCAYCLRMLDCAPHLPVAPSPSYPAPHLVPGMSTASESRHHVDGQIEAFRRARAAVQGGR